MFSAILIQYDPKDKRSHAILKYFADELNEQERSLFIEKIFEKDSWELPTEISSSSDFISLKEKTNNKFYQIFNSWVNERIEHCAKINPDVKNPFITVELTLQFREALLSLRNLNFSKDIMEVFGRFLEQSNTNYLKKFLKSSLSIVIEEYNEAEIESFFTYLSNKYLENKTSNYTNLIYIFLNSLAFSHKIHDLSPKFVTHLKNVSKSIQNDNYSNNYSLLLSILLIDLIDEKKLDLSSSKYNELITETLTKLEKGNIESLDFFKFLNQFNYSFSGYDFNNDIDALFRKISINVSKVRISPEDQKAHILYHYLKTSNKYFELILFYIRYCTQEQAAEHFIHFIKIIDELRNSFTSLILFDEFLNFKPIKGEISSIILSGFNVKIDEKNLVKEIKEKQNEELFFSEKLASQYEFGFLNESNLIGFPKAKRLFNTLSKKTDKIENLDLDLIEELKSFFIINVNYSKENKRSIFSLIPETKASSKIISRFELKAFFSAIELFLIEKGNEYLELEYLFAKRNNIAKILVPSNYIYNYKLGFPKEKFWDILKKYRPIIYDAIIIKDNEDALKQIVYAFDNNLNIQGLIKTKAKGGMIVDIFGMEAFLPGSQIDTKAIRDYDVYVGKTMDFKVLKINNEFKNVVISHRALIESEIEIQKRDFLSKLEKGQVLEGVVKNITSYGVFIDLGGVDGLIHITDLSWGRINHPEEIVKLDEKINVVILDFDDDKKRIALGLKQLSTHPWDILDSKFSAGKIVKAKIVLILSYGAMLEISSGVEGLLHVSEIQGKKNRSAFDKYKIGEQIEVVIIKLKRIERLLSFGIKEDTKKIIIKNENASINRQNMSIESWNKIKSSFPIYSIHNGTIIKNLDNGALVLISNGLEAFSPKSHLLKSNGILAENGETLAFKIIDFKQKSKTVIVSHSSTNKFK